MSDNELRHVIGYALAPHAGHDNPWYLADMVLPHVEEYLTEEKRKAAEKAWDEAVEMIDRYFLQGEPLTNPHREEA